MRAFVLVIANVGGGVTEQNVTLHRTIHGALTFARDQGYPLYSWRSNEFRSSGAEPIKVYHAQGVYGAILHLPVLD